MNCSQAGSRLASLHDGELDASAAAALRSHIADCPHCSAELVALEQLSRDLRAQVPRHVAPSSLRARVADAVVATGTASPAAQRGERAPAAAPAWPLGRAQRRWFAAGALAGALLAVVLGAATLALVQRHASDEVALEAVDNHVRATLAHQLVAVASSDRHTVKPWLSARLDYAAPVFELPESGFALAGARIDSLDRRPVATLVYRYGNHVVDVFVRPLAPVATGPRLATVRGFNVARAEGAGMEWRAVADVDAAVLAPFVERLAAAASPPAAAR